MVKEGVATMNPSKAPASRVLVVEDDERLRNWLKLILQRKGFVVDVAVDGKDGMARLEAGSYDVLILDLLMPQMSGFEVLMAMEQRAIRIPTAITSGIVIPGVHDYLKTHPGVRLLSKPYTPEDLFGVIQLLLDAARGKTPP
jgi:DNA-binding response OmpR family regulator